MRFAKYVLVLCIIFQLVNDVFTIYRDTPDFDIDDELPMTHHFHGDPDIRGFERIMIREMAEDEPEFFNVKEKRIRDALMRSKQDLRSQRTLSEVLPIIKSLSEQQRLTLAALISTQTNPKSGKSLDLQQVCISFFKFLMIIFNSHFLIDANCQFCGFFFFNLKIHWPWYVSYQSKVASKSVFLFLLSWTGSMQMYRTAPIDMRIALNRNQEFKDS